MNLDELIHRDTPSTLPEGTVEPDELRLPGLVILGHPDAGRVGEQVLLPELVSGQEVRLSRLEPVFSEPGGPRGGPLALVHLSRKPIRLLPGERLGSVCLDVTGTRTHVVVDGELVVARHVFTEDDLEDGAVIVLSRSVVLLFCLLEAHPESGADLGLVGASSAVERLRRQIRRVAPLDAPVLLRGATGTGKELVARAVHDASPRREGPFLAINMGALTPSLAAAELFGAARGAYTGADRKKAGFFQSCEGGTLFLDEIGETPPEVQVMLLRVLENHEIQPLGSVEVRKVDVRVVAATDSALESAIREGRFRSPLLHRLSGHVLRVPALRERRDDIGRLLFHFLRWELGKMGELERLEGDGVRPWPPADLMARLARYAWPGNVRQLRNVACRLVALGAELRPSDLEDLLEEVDDPAVETALPNSLQPGQAAPEAPVAPEAPAVFKRRGFRKPTDVGEEELLAALREHRYNPKPAADALGVSRATLFRLMEACPRVCKAAELSLEEIESALRDADEDLGAVAERLEVSLQGLKRRMTMLGLAYR